MNIGEIWRRLVFFLRRGEYERELEEELRFHSEMAGPAQFGNLALHKEDSREAWGFGPLERLGQDLRYAVRMLRKSPAFPLVAVLSLALGIGANTAVFSLINALLLRPLPILHPEQLVSLSRSNMRSSGMTSFPYPYYQELRQSNLLTDPICQAAMEPSLSLNGSAEIVGGEMVSGNYFAALGVYPYAGRLLQPDDEAAQKHVAVLSYGFWQRRFAGDRSVIGKTIRLNTTLITVVGVSPAGFSGLQAGFAPDIRVPITLQPEMYMSKSMLHQRDDFWLHIVGRAEPGIARSQREAALTTFTYNYLLLNAGGQKLSEYRKRLLESGRMSLLPAGSGIESRVTTAAKQLYILMSIVGLVLLIACVNIANLLLARSATRQREIALRIALGATRLRLVRQLLTESILLSLLGASAGALLAIWGARFLFSYLMPGLTTISIDFTLDWRVLTFTLAVSLLTGILFGLAPAMKSTRFEVGPELKGERTLVPGTRILWRKILVSAQISLSLILLIGAGLFLRSLMKLRAQDPGFDSHHVLTLSMNPAQSGYDNARARQFYREVADRVSSIPAVQSVSLARVGLATNSNWGSGITVEGYQPKEGDDGPNRNAVGAGYFRTLKIPLLRGRDFSPRDTGTAPHVAIINERFAEFYFAGRDPIGKHIGRGGDAPDYTIIGIAKDGKYSNLRQPTPRFWYIPYEQDRAIRELKLYARTTGAAEQAAADIRGAIATIDAQVPVIDVKSLDEQIDESLSRDRMIATLSGFFAALAALVAAIGLYGVMTYAVTSRTREIGIRMALGAQRHMVIQPIMRETAILAAAGVVLGTSCALALGRLVSSLLFDMAPSDQTTFITAAGLMIAIALGAGYLPARRAAQVDPTVTLRYD
jgi:predicted permease